MKPFRATYRKRDVCTGVEEDPEEVLVLAVLPTLSGDPDPEVAFVYSDGRLGSDWIGRFTNCRVPWPER